jgi:2,3,4,5-tetrahydropyridine-2-carboxylate N-succinyltransferase
MDNARSTIERAWEDRANLSPASAPADVRAAIEQALAGLDSGRLRVAEKSPSGWVTHQWLKMAVLLSFRIEENRLVEGAAARYYDKVRRQVRLAGTPRHSPRRASGWCRRPWSGEVRISRGTWC